MTRANLALLAVLVVVLALPASGSAEPAGNSTLEETIRMRSSTGFRLLETGPGDPFVVRKSSLGRHQDGRASRRRSLIFLGQFTDPQVADEMTPPRLDLLDEADDPLQDGVRPQESLETQLFDQMIRNMNANRTSAVKPGKGKNARLQFAIDTGDMADSQQLNETGTRTQRYPATPARTPTGRATPVCWSGPRRRSRRRASTCRGKRRAAITTGW